MIGFIHIGAQKARFSQMVEILAGAVQRCAGASRDVRFAGFAAPSGRTLISSGGWGCILTLISAPTLAFDLPSGLPVEFQESFYERQDDGGLWARFRFVMPAIGAEDVGYAEVADDFLILCENYALPSLSGQDIPGQIIISLADRATEFGVTNPEATQFFEAFRPKDASCIWEDF